MGLKIWHDDIRKPPDGSWVWCRTNDAVIKLLTEVRELTGPPEPFEEISLDHDLGLDHIDPDSDPESIYFAGPSQNGTGLDLVNWMCETGNVPPKITIHSWNPDGASNMAARLNFFGHDCVISRFKP